MSRQSFIPVCEPLFLGNEEDYVSEAVRTGWVSSSGQYIDKFESEFSSYCGTKFGISSSNGTTALHLALRALGVSEGDEVIIPDFSMVAVLLSVLYCGAKPIFIDATEDTWNLDTSLIQSKITERTKAIIAVHTYGHPVEMTSLLELAKKYQVPVVEDAAEAHGAMFKGARCGGLAEISCFSFYANKIITSGEGGMVLTSDSELADKCKYYKNLCFPMKGPRDYSHADVGYNYRLTNVQAALGLAQFEKIEEYIKRRRANAALYNSLLKDVPGIQLPVEKEYAYNVYWMYGIVIDPKKFGKTRDQLMGLLKENGIDSRMFFKPLHSQELLKKYQYSIEDKFTVSKWLAENGFYLPSGSGLKTEEIEYICSTIKEIQRKG